MSKAKTLATTVSTGGALDNPSAIPGANISGAVGSATNLAGGSNGTIPYQSASGTTQMLGVGTASQVLTSAGVGAPTWATPAATGVTSVAATVPSIFSIAGSPITSTGTLAMTYSGTALPIANGGTGTTSTTFANLTTNVTGTLPIANGGTATATPALVQGTGVTITGTWPNQTINATGTGGTVTSVAGAGTVNGITLTGTVTASGSLTLGGTLSGVGLTSQVTGTLPIANGGTNSTATATAGGAGYGTGTAHAYTAAGTSGQVLQSNGASAPTWVTPGGGSWIFLSTVTASNASSADVETTFDSTYDTYLIQIETLRKSGTGSNNNVQIFLKISSYITASNYFWNRNANGTYGSNFDSANIDMTTGLQDNGDSRVSAEVLVHIPTDTTFKHISWNARELSGATGARRFLQATYGGGSVSNSGALTGVRFVVRSENIYGTFRLYGLKTS